MKKKILFLALLAQMCVLTGMAAVQVTVDGLKFEADTEAKTAKVISDTGGGNFYTSDYDGRYVYRKFASTYSGVIIIPDSIIVNDVTCRVTEIGKEAFFECSNLTSVTIPSSVTYIGEGAFYGCGLTSVTIPEGVTSIGNYAFEDCSGLTSVTIPGSVTSIGNYAFEYCIGLTSVTIPGSVTSIGSGAFYNCSGLTSVTIPSSVTSIGYSAFENCSGLTSVTIPSSVTSIGSWAFSRCSNLTSVTINCSNVGSWFSQKTSLTEIILGEGVTSIDNYAFSGCSGLTSVTIPSSVTAIGERAFAGCSYLTDVYCLATTVPVTDVTAFNGCDLSRATLYVPSSALEDYSITEPWSGFETKEALGSYTLTYVVDGVTYKSYNVEGGSEITPEAAPTKEGYTFSGWSEIPATMPDHDVTVTGSFTPNQYNLTYIVDGQLHKYTRVAYGTELTPEPAPTKEGYTFSGWSEIPATMPAHDVTIIGSFTINQYTLTYILDGETYNTSKVDYGTELTPEPTPAKEGYTFSGWSEIPATMPAHDVTVTGTFNINVHTLKYIVDGAVYKTYEVAYGTDITPEAEPTKDGYTFSGWSEIPATMPDHDVRVTGTFKEGLFCAKPTITYENGELVFSCETPGATCISTITADDMGTVVGNRRPLTATYFIKVYAMANGYEDSKMTMALICWMDETSLPVNIEEVEMNEVKARPVLIQNQGGTLVLNGVDDGAEVCVYDLNGRLMGSGTATDGTTRISTKLTSGQVAIVRMGSKSVKVKMQ